MFSSQLNKLKSGIKNGTEVTFNFSSKLIGNSNYGTNFPRKLLLTDTQVSRICKTFTKGSSAATRYSKTQLSKIHSGEVLADLLAAILQVIFLTGIETLKWEIKRRCIICKNYSTRITCKKNRTLC